MNSILSILQVELSEIYTQQIVIFICLIDKFIKKRTNKWH